MTRRSSAAREVRLGCEDWNSRSFGRPNKRGKINLALLPAPVANVALFLPGGPFTLKFVDVKRVPPAP